MLFVFIYVYWCPTRFSSQMMFLSFISNTTGVTSGAGTGTPGFSEVRVAHCLVFCVLFYRSLYVLVLFLLTIVLSVLH